MKKQVRYPRFLRFASTLCVRGRPAARFAKTNKDGSKTIECLSLAEIKETIKFGLGPAKELNKGIEGYRLHGVEA